MSFLGFVANQVQTPRSLNGLVSLMSVYPATLGILSLAIIIFLYPLNDRKMAEVALTLKGRRAEDAKTA